MKKTALSIVAATLLAVLVGINVGWRWVLAPLLAYVLLRWQRARRRP